MRRVAGLVIIGALLTPAAAVAQVEPTPSSEHRLSPQQIEAVLAEAAKKREEADRLAVPGAVDRGPRQMHGEIGMSIGTGGYRDVYGNGIYPLGDDGTAAISLDYVDSGRRRSKR